MVCYIQIGMLPIGSFNPDSDSPLYRQLYLQVRDLIESGRIARGARLPATRELAGQLGLNRTTVSAAYGLLETEGLITGHVGRGSFVADLPGAPSGLPWREILEPAAPISPASPTSTPVAGFASSRPSELLFPIEEFRSTCAEVIASKDPQTILQLGSPSRYPPLRRYLLHLAPADGLA